MLLLNDELVLQMKLIINQACNHCVHEMGVALCDGCETGRLMNKLKEPGIARAVTLRENVWNVMGKLEERIKGPGEYNNSYVAAIKYAIHGLRKLDSHI
jgi:hypothetical protein